MSKKIKDWLLWLINLILVAGLIYVVCRVLRDEIWAAVIISVVVVFVFGMGTMETWNKNQDDNE